MNNDFQICLHNFWVFVTVIPALRNVNTLALTLVILPALVCLDQPRGKPSWAAHPWFSPWLIPPHLAVNLYTYLLHSCIVTLRLTWKESVSERVEKWHVFKDYKVVPKKS